MRPVRSKFLIRLECRRGGSGCRRGLREKLWSGCEVVTPAGKGSDDAFDLQVEEGERNRWDRLAGECDEVFKRTRLFFAEEMDQLGFEGGPSSDGFGVGLFSR